MWWNETTQNRTEPQGTMQTWAYVCHTFCVSFFHIFDKWKKKHAKEKKICKSKEVVKRFIIMPYLINVGMITPDNSYYSSHEKIL